MLYVTDQSLVLDSHRMVINENKGRAAERDIDIAGWRLEDRNQAHKIRQKDEDSERADHGDKFLPGRTDHILHQVLNETEIRFQHLLGESRINVIFLLPVSEKDRAKQHDEECHHHVIDRLVGQMKARLIDQSVKFFC